MFFDSVNNIQRSVQSVNKNIRYALQSPWQTDNCFWANRLRWNISSFSRTVWKTVLWFVRRVSCPDACVVIKEDETRLRYLMRTTYLDACVEVCWFSWFHASVCLMTRLFYIHRQAWQIQVSVGTSVSFAFGPLILSVFLQHIGLFRAEPMEFRASCSPKCSCYARKRFWGF